MVLVRLVNGAAPEYLGGVNPHLELTPQAQVYTQYLEETGLARKTKLARLGRTCRTSKFEKFELEAESFTDVNDVFAFSLGFYDSNLYKQDSKSFTVPAALAADFASLNEHTLYLRNLINEQASVLVPEELARQATARVQASAASVGKADALKVTTVHKDQLLDQGLVGIYTVGKGSANPPVYVEFDYNPTGNPDAPVYASLVGKGITYDSGGLNLKPDGGITMRSDMGGAGLLSAVFAYAIAQGLDKRVTLHLCCAENMISGTSFRPGDTILYPNGVSVAVDNTDAEGRLVLADGLQRASKANNGQRPQYILNAATLTGAAKVAVGTDYHSVFSFDDELAQKVLAASKENNERFWRLPLEEFHRQQITCYQATISNTGQVTQSAGASTAAAFLSYFVEDYQHGWLHLDCSSTFNRRGGEEVAIGATGRGLLTLSSFLLK